MRAIVLLSGGLDSTLAAKLMLDQGVRLTAVNFTSPFCLCSGRAGCGVKAAEMARKLGIPLVVKDLGEKMAATVIAPKYGYGSAVNPCIDCRILKFIEARKLAEETGAEFIVTGEVLGQRPMSQNLKAMNLIEKESGLERLVVRPLSAKVLKPTIPEKKGWVDRKKLLSVNGRSRREQFKLAELNGIKGFACPAGGCLLTDKNFALKTMDLALGGMFSADNARLFKYGRYFTLGRYFKLCVGRDEQENRIIETQASRGDILIKAEGRGPSAVARGRISAHGLRAAINICAFYSRYVNEISFNVKILPGETAVYSVNRAVSPQEVEQYKLSA